MIDTFHVTVFFTIITQTLHFKKKPLRWRSVLNTHEELIRSGIYKSVNNKSATIQLALAIFTNLFLLYSVVHWMQKKKSKSSLYALNRTAQRCNIKKAPFSDLFEAFFLFMKWKLFFDYVSWSVKIFLKYFTNKWKNRKSEMIQLNVYSTILHWCVKWMHPSFPPFLLEKPIGRISICIL